MSKIKFWLLAFIAVFGFSFGTIWVFNLFTGEPGPRRPKSPERPRPEIEAASREHVSEAGRKAMASISARTSEVSAFIRSRQSGSKPFSKEIISWYGKWRVVKPYIPFTKDDGHKEYVEEKFAEHIFTIQELASVLKTAVEGSIKDLEAIENDLAVALRQEILGRSLAPDEIPIAANEFKEAVERMMKASQADAGKAVGGLVVSEVASFVARQILARLGVSTGILAAGAANSWWSLGVTAIIGILVDMVWEWWDDPAGKIEHAMVSSLDKLSSDASIAIKEEMEKIVSQRSEFWNKSVSEMLP